MSRPFPLDRIPPWGWLIVAVLAVGASFRLGLGLERGPAEAEPLVPAAADGGEPRGNGLARYRVRLADGSLVPLAPGRPAVVMVSSTTCGTCASAMRDFGRRMPAGGFPGLRIVTLEGAAAGTGMLARSGLTGVWHAGPADGSGQTLLTFQFPGTPTFLLLDAEGHVRAALPGYPGSAAFAPWFRVMTGEAASI